MSNNYHEYDNNNNHTRHAETLPEYYLRIGDVLSYIAYMDKHYFQWNDYYIIKKDTCGMWAIILLILGYYYTHTVVWFVTSVIGITSLGLTYDFLYKKTGISSFEKFIFNICMLAYLLAVVFVVNFVEYHVEAYTNHLGYILAFAAIALLFIERLRRRYYLLILGWAAAIVLIRLGLS